MARIVFQFRKANGSSVKFIFHVAFVGSVHILFQLILNSWNCTEEEPQRDPPPGDGTNFLTAY